MRDDYLIELGKKESIGRANQRTGLVVDFRGQLCFYEFGNCSTIQAVLLNGRPVFVAAPQDGALYFCSNSPWPSASG